MFGGFILLAASLHCFVGEYVHIPVAVDLSLISGHSPHKTHLRPVCMGVSIASATDVECSLQRGCKG